jgi:autotransporter-associated beta strand protein
MSLQMSGTVASTVNLDVGEGATLVAGNNTIYTNTVPGITLDAGRSIGGLSSLIKLGTGTFILTGSNTYTGSTTINAGTIIADSGAANLPAFTNINPNLVLGSGGLTVDSNSTIIPGGGTLTVTNNFSGTTQLPTTLAIGTNLILQRGLVINGTTVSSGTYTVTNGAINVNGGAVQLNGATVTTGVSTINTGGATLNLNNLTVPGTGSTMLNINSSGTFLTTNGGTLLNLVKSGNGMITLTGINNYSGGITIGSGTVNLGTSTASLISLVLPHGATINGTSVAPGTYQISNGAIDLNGTPISISGATITVPTTTP